MVGFDALASSSSSALALFNSVVFPCVDPGAKADTLEAKRTIDDASFMMSVILRTVISGEVKVLGVRYCFTIMC